MRTFGKTLTRPISLIRLSFLGLSLPTHAVEKITYDEHIFPIFESQCLNCHNPDKKKGDLDLSTYQGTMAGSSGGKISIAGDGVSSKLFTVSVHTEEPVMPPEGEKISKKDADLIRAWIDGGLLENSGSKAIKAPKPSFSLIAIPSGKRPEGPLPMPQDLLLEPVITPQRAITGQRQVLLYHTDSLELVGILPFPEGKGQPETLSFHPSGKYLLAGGGIAGKSGTTVTWDITNGQVMMTMGREFDSVLAADLRADLGGLALGGPSRLIKLWDTQEVTQTHSIKKHTDWITALAYSHDGVLLATGDRSNGVQIWEASSGNEFHSLRGHQGAITDLKWRADSNLIASASEDGSIRFWDMNRGKEVKKSNAGNSGILAMDYARNGRLISASRDHRIKLWKADLTMEKQSNPFPEMITEVAFSHDAQKKATFKDGLTQAQQEASAAESQVTSAREKIKATETKLTTLKADSNRLQKEAEQLQKKWRQLDDQAKAKQKERNSIAKMSSDPAQRKMHLIQQRRQLAAEQQRLTQSHSKAQQMLVSVTRGTSKKREALKKDPQHQKKKEELLASEAHELKQRKLVQQLTAKINAQQKLIEDFSKQSKNPKAEVTNGDARLKKITTEHKQLISQRDQVAQTKSARLAEKKAKLAKIPELSKSIQAQRKMIAEKEKAAQSAKEKLAKAQSSGTQFDAQIKKWQAALINRDLIKARQELNALTLQKEKDPSVLPLIAEAEKRCQTLLTQYRNSQN